MNFGLAAEAAAVPMSARFGGGAHETRYTAQSMRSQRRAAATDELEQAV